MLLARASGARRSITDTTSPWHGHVGNVVAPACGRYAALAAGVLRRQSNHDQIYPSSRAEGSSMFISRMVGIVVKTMAIVPHCVE